MVRFADKETLIPPKADVCAMSHFPRRHPVVVERAYRHATLNGDIAFEQWENKLSAKTAK
jgi:hypothetical protein